VNPNEFISKAFKNMVKQIQGDHKKPEEDKKVNEKKVQGFGSTK